ncbi:MAG: ferritin family protein, partial [Planctomycetota bacterium]
MDETTKKNLVEGLAQAIQSERYGQHFYRMAARASKDAKGAEVFEMLADEELAHERFLNSHHASLLEKGNLDPAAVLGSPADLAGDHPIFSEQVIARAKDAHAEMSALGVGVQIELSSIQFYQAQA